MCEASDTLLADNATFYFARGPHASSRQGDHKECPFAAAFHSFSMTPFATSVNSRATGTPFLEFELELDAIKVNGVDLIKWNDAGLIVEFKVMIRPLKAINLIHQKMAAAAGGQTRLRANHTGRSRSCRRVALSERLPLSSVFRRITTRPCQRIVLGTFKDHCSAVFDVAGRKTIR